MKLAVCVLLAANGALALTPPKSAVAATRTGTAALETALPIAAKEVSAVSRGGVIANFVGVDVALLSYFFFWYLGNYYCPRPRPNLRGDGAATARRRRDVKNSVAQWIAYQTSNLGVAGSSPVGVGCRRHAQFPLAVGHRQGQGLLAGVLSSLPLSSALRRAYPACRRAPPSKLLF